MVGGLRNVVKQYSALRLATKVHYSAHMTPADPVLSELGRKLRAQRHGRGMTVKELAVKSSLSERFVVSVEGGQGNLSLLRLVELARALGCPLTDLVDDAWVQGPTARPLERPVALTGLRGAGKSTIGREVAKRLGVRFYEIDQLISQRAGLSMGEIFEVHGATQIRKLERDVWEGLLLEAPGVIATTGGIVTETSTYERLLATATVVWLKARPADHFNRVSEQGDTRPMANRVNAMRELKAILRARGALYERAHQTVDTSSLGLNRAIERVVTIFR